MVSGEEMNLDTKVDKFGEFAKRTHKAFGYHEFIFVPEIEDVANQIEFGSIIFNRIEPVHKEMLAPLRLLGIRKSQMNI